MKLNGSYTVYTETAAATVKYYGLYSVYDPEHREKLIPEQLDVSEDHLSLAG